MDVDGEDTGLDMEGETTEESMATDIPDSTQFVTNSESSSVTMTTENGEMLEVEEECNNNNNGIGISDINPSHDSTRFCFNGDSHSKQQQCVPGPGVIKTYRTFSKMILSAGFGYTVPKDGTLCNVNIFILNPNSVVPEEVGCETGDNVVIMVGEGDTDIARQLDLCLQTMKQGEICDIEIPLNPTSSLTAACTSCSFRIHLVSFQESVSTWQLLPEEKITRAAHHKEKGTALFQQGKAEFAFRRFSKAFKYLVCCHPEESIPENLQETFRKLKCQCYSNMAACQMKLSRYADVIENCSKAIQLEPRNIKALFRRGQAYLFLGDTDLARADLEMVVSLEPQNKAVIQLLSQLEAKQRQGDIKLAAGLSKMFS